MVLLDLEMDVVWRERRIMLRTAEIASRTWRIFGLYEADGREAVAVGDRAPCLSGMNGLSSPASDIVGPMACTWERV